MAPLLLPLAGVARRLDGSDGPVESSPDGLARSLLDVLLPLGRVARRLDVSAGLLRSLPDFALVLAAGVSRLTVSWKASQPFGDASTAEDAFDPWQPLQFCGSWVNLHSAIFWVTLPTTGSSFD